MSALFVVLCFTACETPEPELIAPDYPYEYFPTDSGRYCIYQVDSIVYNETFANDTSSWQVKEMVTDTFYDAEGRLNYTIERSRRLSAADAWEIMDVWHAAYVNGNVEKVENNLRFIKLAHPVMNGIQWDGNAYLGGLDDIPFDYECNRLSYYEGWDYQYQAVAESFSVNEMQFPNTVTVIQQGDSNLIWYDYAKEVFAEDVGLIYKEFYHYYTQDFTCPTCPWNERVECGYSVRMEIIEYQ